MLKIVKNKWRIKLDKFQIRRRTKNVLRRKIFCVHLLILLIKQQRVFQMVILRSNFFGIWCFCFLRFWQISQTKMASAEPRSIPINQLSLQDLSGIQQQVEKVRFYACTCLFFASFLTKNFIVLFFYRKCNFLPNHYKNCVLYNANFAIHSTLLIWWKQQKMAPPQWCHSRNRFVFLN